MPASFSICCSVCHTCEVWTCSTCQAKECSSSLKQRNGQVASADALANTSAEEPRASASNCPVEFVKCNIKLEPLETICEASEVSQSRDCVRRTSKPFIMRLDEEIQDLERQLQELRRAKVAVAAAFRNDSVIGASSEDASEVTNGASTPTITVANANCESVTDLPSVRNLHEREKDHRQTDGRDANDRLDFLENNMTKLKDKINAIQLNVKSIQAIVKENNFILKRRDLAKPFLPNTLRCRLSPAQTSEELDRIAQHPDMLQLLSEINECTLSRTVTQMLKSLMSKELATKYSLTGLSRRREHSKISFKNSPAYQAVEHAVLSSSNYHSLPRKEIFRAITSALKNSADWDGGRTKRINSKRAEWQAAGQPNAAAATTATQEDVRERTMEENTESTKEELLEMAVSSATVGLPPAAMLGGGEVTLSPVLIPPGHAGFSDMEF